MRIINEVEQAFDKLHLETFALRHQHSVPEACR